MRNERIADVETKTSKRGRVKGTGSQSEHLHIRCSAEQKEAMARRAKKAKMTLTAYVLERATKD